MKFFQTKPQVKNMNIIYYDLFYTVIKTRAKNSYARYCKALEEITGF